MDCFVAQRLSARSAVSGRIIFDTKPVSETATYQFDFSDEMVPEEVIFTQEVVATVYSGTDLTPEAIISGDASHSGSVVSQDITAGTVGVTYLLACSVGTSNGQILIKLAYLTVESD